MSKNLLITFANFNSERFFQNKNRKNWEIISIDQLAKKNYREILKIIRQKREDFILGRDSLEREKAEFIFKTLLFFANAKTKQIIDNQNGVFHFNIFYYFFCVLPLTIFESLLVIIILALTYILLFVWYIWLKLVSKRRFVKIDNKKVVFFRTEDLGSITIGGSYTHTEGFRDGVLKNGYSLFFIAPGPPAHLDEKITPFYKIPYSKFFRNLPEIPEIFYNHILFFKAIPILKKEKPSFIYHRHSIFSCIVGILARIFKIPYILETNGSEVWLRKHWSRLFLVKLAKFFEYVALSSADVITVVSEVAKQDMIQLGIPENKILINCNGVDPERFNPDIDSSDIGKELNIVNKIVVGFCSSFYQFHGVEVLAKAIPLVIKKNSNVKFLLIGEGMLRGVMEKQLQEANMSDYVVFTGSVPHSNVPQYLLFCDILVACHIPNLDGTPFFGSPTKLFEYMAMGKSIVASDLDQIGQVLEHKKTAWLVKPGDINDLVNGILQLARDRELRETLGKNARKEVVKNYTWKQNAKRVIDFYLKII